MLPGLNQLKLPDPWQHQAVNHLRAGSDVIVSAPTGAGKTYIFEILHQSGHLKGQAVYTVPTRALANDKYAEWKEARWDVGIATGDVSENIHAPVLVATLETQIERLVRGEGPALLVIDEYQMIADASRGSHYEGAVALAPEGTRLLLLSGSVANPDDVAAWLRHLGRPAEVVLTKERPVPLEEAPLENLPQRLARHFDGYWPKFAAAVLLADLAPLLIFAPRRKEAESIARKLAAELPPGDPLQLTAEQRAVCGKELSQLLERRIAYHHSGLSYGARAGVIEPLAKAGQLRVITATMGLAAGINFSVRSVHVAATTFHDGRGEHRLTSDELLQMFGRAGRRGLDERGSVITTNQSPGLNDARAARLHRGSVLAWPLFLRVMKHAASTGADPFTAAETFAARLYAKVPPPLGLEDLPEGAAPSPEQPATAALFGLESFEKQLLSTTGEWERRSGYPPRRATLAECWLATPERVTPALAFGPFAGRFANGLGRVFRLEQSDPDAPRRFGVELPLGALQAGSSQRFRPTKNLRKLLKLPRRIEHLDLGEIEQQHLPALAAALVAQVPTPKLEGAPVLVEFHERDGILHARFDLSPLETDALEDSHHRPILEPHERVLTKRAAAEERGASGPLAVSANVNPPRPSSFEDEDEEENEDHSPARRPPRPGSPIHAWQQLGLIARNGVPTRRGEIFSFFQGGEGLAVVAALEDESYPVDELVLHLANLRAGVRFDLPELDPSGRSSQGRGSQGRGHPGRDPGPRASQPAASERLGAACRAAYGFINHHGYLENGLPLDYGEGAAEVLDALLHPDRPGSADLRRGIPEGDLSRAYVEWLSQLRHIHHAPSHDWPRWTALQEAARATLKHHTTALRHLFHLDLPPLTNRQKTGRVRHVLHHP